VPYGPWAFDTAADVPADWGNLLASTKIGWVAQGPVEPFGSMVIDTSTATGGLAKHDFVNPVDLRGHKMTVRVRAANADKGDLIVSLYANSNTPSWAFGTGAAVVVGLTWATVELNFDSPGTTDTGYNAQYVTRVAVQLTNPGVLWVDSVTITPQVGATTSGTGGTSSGGTSGT
jgi:hypothetical protein